MIQNLKVNSVRNQSKFKKFTSNSYFMSFIPAVVEGGVWMSRAEKKEKCTRSSSVSKFSK